MLPACVIDGPLTAQFRGHDYIPTCIAPPDGKLGAILDESADVTRFGSVPARALASTDAGEAVALLIPGSYCGNESSTWLLVFSDSLPDARQTDRVGVPAGLGFGRGDSHHATVARHRGCRAAIRDLVRDDRSVGERRVRRCVSVRQDDGHDQARVVVA